MRNDMEPSPPLPQQPTAIEVDDHFDDLPFTLSAGALKRITDIIVARLTGEVSFDVGYADGTRLCEIDLERVLNDDNPERHSINEVKCHFRSSSPKNTFDRIVLRFTADYSSPISLMVSSTDRERVWLTVAELRDFVSNEVAGRLRLPKWVKASAVVCATVGCCWLLIRWGLVLASPTVQHPTLADAMRSADPNVKLNYLLEQQSHSGELVVPWYIVLSLFAIGLLAFLALGQMLLEGAVLPVSLFPRNHFLIGKGEERYRRQKRLRSNLFWGVFVALAVSVLAGVVVLLFSISTKPS